MKTEKCWYKNKCKNKCSETCVRYSLMKSLYKQSRLSESQWEYKVLSAGEVDNSAFCTLRAICDDILNFVDHGETCYIYSAQCGNGKTSWAIRIMDAYFKKIWHKCCFECKALFISVPDFLYNSKRNISFEVKGFDELCEMIDNVDLVIWDEIGCTGFTEYEYQIIYKYINNRVNNGKANVFTSNKSPNEIRDLISPNLASRITNGTVVQFREQDKRGWN